jgi:hypothetical protein
MPDNLHSNICIKSNIYILSTEYAFSDKQYISKILENNALKKLSSLSTTAISELQKKIKEMNLPCACHPDRSVTPGVILKNGKYYQVIRCNIINTCPNAKRGHCKDLVEINYQHT